MMYVWSGAEPEHDVRADGTLHVVTEFSIDVAVNVASTESMFVVGTLCSATFRAPKIIVKQPTYGRIKSNGCKTCFERLGLA